MWKIFERFNRKRDAQLEERLSEQVIREEEERLEEARQNELPATVIVYRAGENDDEPPHMEILVDDFKCAMLPETGSVIWVEIENWLRPCQVIRYDFIQNSSEYDSMRVYVVVHPANRSTIIPNPYFGINE